MQRKIRLATSTAEESRKLGLIMGSNLSGGEIITLSGNLGAGKTTLGQGIIEGAGGKISAASPTFILDAVYTLPSRAPFKELHHLDFYRLTDPGELVTLGLADTISDPRASVIIEWADLFPFFSPHGFLQVKIKVAKDGEREVSIAAEGDLHRRYLARLSPHLKPYYFNADRKK